MNAFLDLEQSIQVEITLGSRLVLSPRWELKHRGVAVEPFHTAQECEAHYSATIGTGEPYRLPYADGLRFDPEGLGLQSAYFNVPDEPFVAREFLDGWLHGVSESGTLRLMQGRSFTLDPATMRWMEPKGAFLACINDLVAETAGDHMRLHIAQDLDLLFLDCTLCGWMLFRPARYLAHAWSLPNALEPEDDRIAELSEFLELVEDRHIMQMESREPRLHRRLIELRQRLADSRRPGSKLTVLLDAVEDVIDRFYGSP